MGGFRIDFESENGISQLFNDAHKHTQDDKIKLVPFTTTKDKTSFKDFSGVVGAFSRLIYGGKVKLDFDIQDIYKRIDKVVVCQNEEEKEKIYQMINELYLHREQLIPFNIKSMNYIKSNSDQEKLAYFLYTMFVSDEIKSEYEKVCTREESNVLEKLIFYALPGFKDEEKKNKKKYECFLPYVRNVFQKDIMYLLNHPDLYMANLKRFLEYYFMFYIVQLAIKLSKFERGKRDEIERVYMTLSWEVTSSTRIGYEKGWKDVKKTVPKLFSHAVTLEFIARNNESCLLDYIGAYEKFDGSMHDEVVAKQIRKIRNEYERWIKDKKVEFSECKHSEMGKCRTSGEIRYLFESINYQFINGTRKAAYGRYTARFIES